MAKKVGQKYPPHRVLEMATSQHQNNKQYTSDLFSDFNCLVKFFF